MPGSSVSSCHLCHMHSHSPDSLVRTSPLRQSPAKGNNPNKFQSHRKHHHHHHANGGYNSSSRGDDGCRIHRCNSASALTRLNENSHSLPGSRSNSLSRYHQEVSILPNGGEMYGREMRSSSSSRSLDMNPPIVTLLDTRTTSLPRIPPSIHSPAQIHPQPDILVSAMPRSRTNSRSGSLPRAPVSLGQDNSHDYYLHMHRQRFKEEKRKHRFNLQTVMLIGCYTLLVMVAIVVGVVVCYQNGWLGLGVSQGKIAGEKVSEDNINNISQDLNSIENRGKQFDSNLNDINGDSRTRLRNNEDNNLNFRSFAEGNRGLLNSPSLFPTSESFDRSRDVFINNGNIQKPRTTENKPMNFEGGQIEVKNHRQGKMHDGTFISPENDSHRANSKNPQIISQKGDNILHVNPTSNPRQVSTTHNQKSNIVEGVLLDEIFVPAINRNTGNVRTNQVPTTVTNQQENVFIGNNRNVEINLEAHRHPSFAPTNINHNLGSVIPVHLTPPTLSSSQDQVINTNSIQPNINLNFPRQTQNKFFVNSPSKTQNVQNSNLGSANLPRQSERNTAGVLQVLSAGTSPFGINSNSRVAHPSNFHFNTLVGQSSHHNNQRTVIPLKAQINPAISNQSQDPFNLTTNLKDTNPSINQLNGLVGQNIQQNNQKTEIPLNAQINPIVNKQNQNPLVLNTNLINPNPSIGQINPFIEQISHHQSNQRTRIPLSFQINSSDKNQNQNPVILPANVNNPDISIGQINSFVGQNSQQQNNQRPQITLSTQINPSNKNQNQNPTLLTANLNNLNPSIGQINSFVGQNSQQQINQRLQFPINTQINPSDKNQKQNIFFLTTNSNNPNPSVGQINSLVGQNSQQQGIQRTQIPLNTQINPSDKNQNQTPFLLTTNSNNPNPSVGQISSLVGQNSQQQGIQRTQIPLNTQINPSDKNQNQTPFLLNTNSNNPNPSVGQINSLVGQNSQQPGNQRTQISLNTQINPSDKNQNQTPFLITANSNNPNPSVGQINSLVGQNSQQQDTQRTGVPINTQINPTINNQIQNPPLVLTTNFKNPTLSTGQINSFAGQNSQHQSNQRTQIPLNTQINPSDKKQNQTPFLITTNSNNPNPSVGQINSLVGQNSQQQRTGVPINTQINPTVNNQIQNPPLVLTTNFKNPILSTGQINSFAGQNGQHQNNQRTQISLNTQINPSLNNQSQNQFILTPNLVNQNPPIGQINSFVEQNSQQSNKRTEVPFSSQINPATNNQIQNSSILTSNLKSSIPSNDPINSIVFQNSQQQSNHRNGIPLSIQSPSNTNPRENPLTISTNIKDPNSSSNQVNIFAGQRNQLANLKTEIQLNNLINSPFILSRNLEPPNISEDKKIIAGISTLPAHRIPQNSILKDLNSPSTHINNINNTNKFKLETNISNNNIPPALGNVESNTIAKALNPGRISISVFEQPRNNPNDFGSAIGKLHANPSIPDKKSGFVVPPIAKDVTITLAIKDPQNSLLSQMTSNLTTQELLDLLAIRRMRDLLNANGNTKNILDLLKNAEPSKESRLAFIKEEKLDVPDINSGPIEVNNLKRGSGRSIEGSIKLDSNDFKIQDLIQALNTHSRPNKTSLNIEAVGDTQKNDRDVLKKVLTQNVDEVQSRIQSINTGTSSLTISNLVNSTLGGAIIRLLNRRTNNSKNDESTPTLTNTNLKEISVVPLNSRDLRTLLESDLSNSPISLDTSNDGKQENLQILRKLIELTNKRQEEDRQVKQILDDLQSEFPKAPVTRSSLSSSSISGNSEIPPTLETHNLPSAKIEKAVRNTLLTVTNGNADVSPAKVIHSVTNGDNSANKRRRPSSRSQIQAAPQARGNGDPGLAVMIRNDELATNATKTKVTFPPHFISQQTERTRDKILAESIREQVAVHPGRARAKSAVIRAWKHMDSTGTLSRGKVLSDGSFTFTNCRPVDVCREPKKDA